MSRESDVAEHKAWLQKFDALREHLEPASIDVERFELIGPASMSISLRRIADGMNVSSMELKKTLDDMTKLLDDIAKALLKIDGTLKTGLDKIAAEIKASAPKL